jgi:uncharacterized protein
VKISGKATLQHPPERVWTALNDPAVLVATIPGCERLERTGPDRYRMTITAGVASITGTYVGDVELADPTPPSAFTLRASGAGAPGTVSADVRVTLDPAPDGGGTLLKYAADATVGGAVGGVGQRVLSGVARKTATQFFAAVDAHLAAQPAAATAADGDGVPADAGQVADAVPADAEPAAAAATAQPVPPAPAAEPVPVAAERPLTIDVTEHRPVAPAPQRQAPVVYTRPTNPAATAKADLNSHALAALAGAALALFAAWVGGRISRRRA